MRLEWCWKKRASPTTRRTGLCPWWRVVDSGVRGELWPWRSGLSKRKDKCCQRSCQRESERERHTLASPCLPFFQAPNLSRGQESRLLENVVSCEAGNEWHHVRLASPSSGSWMSLTSLSTTVCNGMDICVLNPLDCNYSSHVGFLHKTVSASTVAILSQLIT